MGEANAPVGNRLEFIHGLGRIVGIFRAGIGAIMRGKVQRVLHKKLSAQQLLRLEVQRELPSPARLVTQASGRD